MRPLFLPALSWISLSVMTASTYGVTAEFSVQPRDTFVSASGGTLPAVEVLLSAEPSTYSVAIEKNGLDVTSDFAINSVSTQSNPPGTTLALGFSFESARFDVSQIGTYLFKFLIDGKVAATSKPCFISVLEPVILRQPTDTTILQDATVKFDCEVLGRPPLDYHWTLSDQELDDGGFISGSQTENLTITYVAQRHNGIYQLIVDNGFATAASQDFRLSVDLTYQKWQEIFFTEEQRSLEAISGPNADPDGDGYPNLAEYALHLDPRVFNDSGIVRLSDLQIQDSVTQISLRFPIVRAATDLTYQVMSSDDLLHWSPFYTVQPDDFTFEDTSLKTVDMTLTNRSAAFLRLDVTRKDLR